MNAKKSMALIVLVLILVTATLVSAASMTTPISAIMDSSAKMLWNGEAFAPADPNGTVLSPIIYNNRTYLPARALLEKAGYKVGFDVPTRTTVITSQGGVVTPDPTTPPVTTPSANTYTFDARSALPKGTIAQTTMNLSPDAVLILNGVKSKLDLNDAAKLGEFSASSVKVVTDDKGTVTSIEANGQPDPGNAARFTITITVSYPPLKMVITVRF